MCFEQVPGYDFFLTIFWVKNSSILSCWLRFCVLCILKACYIPEPDSNAILKGVIHCSGPGTLGSVTGVCCVHSPFCVLASISYLSILHRVPLCLQWGVFGALTRCALIYLLK